MKKFIFLINGLLLLNCSKSDDSTALIPDDSIYFPPKNTEEWATKSMSSLGWNEGALPGLETYLATKSTKGFLILHNGKIVLERYYNGHSASTPWYWASAGKTLTTSIVGIAAAEGFINIESKVSDYLGVGWTNAPVAKENLILNNHLLSMTSGLDDSLGDAVSAVNLQYKADAGSRWAYHNVYVKLQDVVSQATNQSWSSYFNSKLRDKIGMTGAWYNNTDFSVYWSSTRSMARFGLLASQKGKWENEQIVPENFMTAAVSTSQSLNVAYGYLWWLNGKSSYRLPQTQIQFSGSLIPNAPSDMYCALGKDDQKIYIIPSKKLVIIIMGAAADGTNFALSNFDNELWGKINTLIN